MKECYLCYNTNEEELEEQTLYTDSHGNEAEEKIYICKEGKGCSI